MKKAVLPHPSNLFLNQLSTQNKVPVYFLLAESDIYHTYVTTCFKKYHNNGTFF